MARLKIFYQFICLSKPKIFIKSKVKDIKLDKSTSGFITHVILEFILCIKLLYRNVIISPFIINSSLYLSQVNIDLKIIHYRSL